MLEVRALPIVQNGVGHREVRRIGVQPGVDVLGLDRHDAANVAGRRDLRRGLVGERSERVVSGLLSLPRNLGLITGASVMGAVFAFGSGSIDITAARPQEVAAGMRITFAVALLLLGVALAMALGSCRRTAGSLAIAAGAGFQGNKNGPG